MTKKRIGTMAACLALVGAVAVGGTLALLSNKSNIATNTFTVGNGYPEEISLELTEANVKQDLHGNYVQGDGRKEATDFTLEYPKVVAGTNLYKDPTFDLVEGSPDSWVVARISEVDEAFVGSNFDDENGWYKVIEKDGTYTATPVEANTPITASLYIYGQIVNDASTISPLFTNLDVIPGLKDDATIDDMVINGCAVQAVGDNVTDVNDAVDAVVKVAVEKGL